MEEDMIHEEITYLLTGLAVLAFVNTLAFLQVTIMIVSR
jgi:hypothetical protein